MALEARRTPARNQNVASEETQQETTARSTKENADAKEHTKKRTNSKQTAQQQQDAQPEAENLLQGLTQMDAPKAPEAEDDDVRRVSNEFVLRWSPEAQDHVKGKPADFIKLVTSSAYARIYLAEAVLCGAIAVIPIGRVAPVEKFDKWWTAFKVGDLWFVLRYHDTPIREYEIVPAFGPTPGNGGPAPTMTRQQRRPAPQRIGPRQRRNRGDAQGSRASATGKQIKSAVKGAKKKIDGAKRAIIEHAQRTVWELEARNVGFITDINQLWRQNLTRLDDAICDASFMCGSAVQTLRDVCGTFVQETLALMNSSRASFTYVDDGATETNGPSGHLADSDAGHGIFRRLELKSWKWKTPPIAWNDDLFGVLWTNDLFGVREEERAYT
jgi:hypothetical protein